MDKQMFEVKVERIFRLENGNALKAFVDVSINAALLVKGIRVIEGKNGLFISMPQEKSKDNKWYDIVKCLSGELREQITEEVLSSYNADCIVNQE